MVGSYHVFSDSDFSTFTYIWSSSELWYLSYMHKVKEISVRISNWTHVPFLSNPPYSRLFVTHLYYLLYYKCNSREYPA